MKTKIIINISIVLVSFFSTTFAQFPLEVGNRWDYVEGWWDGSGNSSKDTVTYTVISDTLLANGKVYYKVIPENYFFFKQLMREDSLGIYFYDIYCDKEWLFYSYKLPLGLYVPIGNNNCDTTDAPKIYKSIDSSSNVFGQTVRYMKFSYEGGIDNFYTAGLTLEYGFTDWSTADLYRNYYSYLLGCKLSGNVYGTLTSVNEENHLINNFTLKQNYPNPFNSYTKIMYALPENLFVNFSLYDCLGKTIMVLVNERQGPGVYSVEINGISLSSGIYFYRLMAGPYIEIKKIVLLK